MAAAQKKSFSDQIGDLSVDEEGFFHVTQQELADLLKRATWTGWLSGAMSMIDAFDTIMDAPDSDEEGETESPSGNARSEVTMAGDSAAHRKTQMITRARRLKDFPNSERLSGKPPPAFDKDGNVIEFPLADRLYKGL